MAADVQARAVLLENRALTGTFTTSDNVVLANGDRVLVPNQTLMGDNDLYIANSSGAWARDTGTTLTRWMDIQITEGDDYGGSRWSLKTSGPYLRDGSQSLVFPLDRKLPYRSVGAGLEEVSGQIRLPLRPGVEGEWTKGSFRLTDRGIAAYVKDAPGDDTFISGFHILRDVDLVINGIAVEGGTLFIPGVNRVVSLDTGITDWQAGLGLGTSANQPIRIYVGISAAGSPYIYASTNAPVAYSGEAKYETGNLNSRYIGQLVSDGVGAIKPFLQVGQGGEIFMRFLMDSAASPLRVVSGATAQTNQTVNLGPSGLNLVPPYCKEVWARVTVNASASVAISNSDAPGNPAATGGIEVVSTAQRGADIRIPLDASQSFTWANQAGSGSTNIDLLGYWDRR